MNIAGHDRLASFWVTLIVHWTIYLLTVVSSFQHATIFSPPVHHSTPKSSQSRNQQQWFSLHSSIETHATEASTTASEKYNAYWNEEEFGLKYLSSSKQKYSSKTIHKAYQRQKQIWADRYTSVEALRETFGTNQNKLWGDLEAGTARRLYKTLLPRALLELSRVGVMPPEDLAPLAYEARVAAKLYARERCTMPARLGATLYDGFRNLRAYGSFQAHGLTYEQLWQKYANAIVLDEAGQVTKDDRSSKQRDNQLVVSARGQSDSSLVNVKVCQKIIERSCQTNEMVDTLFLDSNDFHQNEFLENIHHQLQRDISELLLPLKSAANKPLASRRQFRTLRLIVRAKQIFSIMRQERWQPLQEATVSIKSYNQIPKYSQK